MDPQVGRLPRSVYLLPHNCIVCITKTFSRRRVSPSKASAHKPATWKPQYSNASLCIKSHTDRVSSPCRSPPPTSSSPPHDSRKLVSSGEQKGGIRTASLYWFFFEVDALCTLSPIIVGRTAKISHPNMQTAHSLSLPSNRSWSHESLPTCHKYSFDAAR